MSTAIILEQRRTRARRLIAGGTSAIVAGAVVFALTPELGAAIAVVGAIFGIAAGMCAATIGVRRLVVTSHELRQLDAQVPQARLLR